MYEPLFLCTITQYSNGFFKVDDDSEDDDSGSDIRSGPPRKRRRHLSSGQGTSILITLLSLCCRFVSPPADIEAVASKQHTPSAQSPSDSESDIDGYGGSRRAVAAKKQQRRSLQPARDITPAHGEVRFSTRKAAKVSNYNEDDDDMFDDEADMMPQNNWDVSPEENVPAIDAVLNHRLRDDTSKLARSEFLGSRLISY